MLARRWSEGVRFSMVGTMLFLIGALGIAQAQTTITFWHVWGGARLPMIEQMIDDFEALHPDIKVEHTLLDQADLAARYLTSIAAGTPADVLMMHSGRFFPAFGQRALLVDLTSYLERDGLNPADIFYPSDVQNFTWAGVPYALPVSTDSGGWNLFYDVDDFVAAGLDPDRPPTTWQELEEYAAALTVREGNQVTRLGASPASVGNFAFKEWLYLNNGEFISEDGRQILFDSDEGREALAWMVDFYQNLYGGFEDVIGLIGQPAVSGYNSKGNWYNGLESIHIDGVWHLAELEANAPDKNVRVALMPYNADNPDATVRNVGGVGWGYAIPVASRNHEAAWEFIKYVTAGEGNLNFFLAQGRPTPVVAYNDDPRFSEGNPFWDIFLESGALTAPIVNTPVQEEVDRIVLEMTELALRGRVAPDVAIANAASEAQALLDEYWDNQ